MKLSGKPPSKHRLFIWVLGCLVEVSGVTWDRGGFLPGSMECFALRFYVNDLVIVWLGYKVLISLNFDKNGLCEQKIFHDSKIDYLFQKFSKSRMFDFEVIVYFEYYGARPIPISSLLQLTFSRLWISNSFCNSLIPAHLSNK